MSELRFREISRLSLREAIDGLASYLSRNPKFVAVIYSPGSHSPAQISAWSSVQGTKVLWKGSSLPRIWKFLLFFVAQEAIAIEVNADTISRITLETIDLAYSELYLLHRRDLETVIAKIEDRWRFAPEVSAAFISAPSAVTLYIDGEEAGEKNAQVAYVVADDFEFEEMTRLREKLEAGPIV